MEDSSAAGIEILTTLPTLSSAVIKLSKAKLGAQLARQASLVIANKLQTNHPQAIVIRRETRSKLAIFFSLSETNPSELSPSDFFPLPIN